MNPRRRRPCFSTRFISCLPSRRAGAVLRHTEPVEVGPAARGQLLLLCRVAGRVPPAHHGLDGGGLRGGPPDGKARGPARTPAVAHLSLVTNLGLLFTFKYLNFASESVPGGLRPVQRLLRDSHLRRPPPCRHLVLHLPDPELHDRGLPGDARSRSGTWASSRSTSPSFRSSWQGPSSDRPGSFRSSSRSTVSISNGPGAVHASCSGGSSRRW
jgi:hypothetical protein